MTKSENYHRLWLSLVESQNKDYVMREDVWTFFKFMDVEYFCGSMDDPYYLPQTKDTRS